MSRLEDIFRNEAEIQLAKESHEYYEEIEYKPFTVRIPAPVLSAMDNLARTLGKTRNDIASDLITIGLEDAVRGYSSVYVNPNEVYEQIMNGCVPDPWAEVPAPEEKK